MKLQSSFRSSHLRIFASSLLVLFALPALAAFSGLPDGVKANLPAIKEYPKAAAILLWVQDSYSQEWNGPRVYERHEFRYLPDEAARDTWGDPHIAYDDHRQKIEIITARTYTSDGRTIDATPHNAYNPVTPDNLDHAPDFANFKHMVVTLLGLENGCIAELHYKLTTEQPLFPWLWGRAYFREEVPVVARELKVELSSGLDLRYAVANGAPEPLANGSTYIWRMGEQPGYSNDDLRGHRVLLPNVAFTTAKGHKRVIEDWEEVVGELRRRVTEASDSIALPVSLRRKLAGTLETESQLDSIKAWVRERFNEIEFDHPDFLITLRPSSRVLESGYGHSLELAVLVANLCNRAGLANPAGISMSSRAWFAFTPPVPYLYDLTGGLVSVITEIEEIECDPLASRKEFPEASLVDATIIYLGERSVTHPFFPLPPEDMPKSEIYVNLCIDALDADTIRGTGTLLARGWQTPYEALRTNPNDYFEHLIDWQGFSAENVSIKLLYQQWTSASFSFACAAPEVVDEFHVLPANLLNFAQFSGNPNFGLEHKEFPHWIEIPGEISVHLEAPLPDGWVVDRQPSALSHQWKDGSGTRTVATANGRLVLDQRLTLGNAWIPPQDWDAFRTYLFETGSRPNNIFVFGTKSN